MLKITDIIMPPDFCLHDVRAYVLQLLRADEEDITELKILRQSVQKEDKSNLHWRLTAAVALRDSERESRLAAVLRKKGVSLYEPPRYKVQKSILSSRPVIAGFGPAGIFAALVLAEAGAKPIVLERGLDVDSRRRDTARFFSGGELSSESNIQFGEGGAGAFSDGKLKVGEPDARKNKVLRELADAGAPESILYLAKPHIGSDVLPETVKSLRRKIISLGGEVYFSSKVTRLLIDDGKLRGVGYEQNGEYKETECERLVFAMGHSARDTFEYMRTAGVVMEAKGFGIGVRIEHPQELIDRLEYGSAHFKKQFGAADYKLVTHLPGGRSVYTFCMCPGGYVVAAASEKGHICTNGMSEYSRDGDNANTAMLVSVTTSDFSSADPLAGIELQRKIEAAAYRSAGESYRAPAQRLEDFMMQRSTVKTGSVKPTYAPGVTLAAAEEYLPEYITSSLREALYEMFAYMPGYYYPDALLTGPETRTTSPVRILRNSAYEAVGIKGLYPCGEGAGYAGGIISAACDGIKCAEAVLGKI